MVDDGYKRHALNHLRFYFRRSVPSRKAAEHPRAVDSRSALFRFASLRSTRATDAERWARKDKIWSLSMVLFACKESRMTNGA